MSRATRMQKAATRIQSPDSGVGHLGRNAAGIPGGVGSVDISSPVEIAGYRWDSRDGRWDCGSPIGAALAVEMAGKA